jgi:hypothetical protein
MGNFLTANIAGLESMQENEIVYGYQYNRIVAILTGLNPLNITAGSLIATSGSISGDLVVAGRIIAGVDPGFGTGGDLIANRGGVSPGTGLVFFGNAGNHYLYYNGTEFQLTADLDLLTTHALLGVTTLTTSGAINGQTISSAANFTGTMAVGGNFTANLVTVQSQASLGAGVLSLGLATPHGIIIGGSVDLWIRNHANTTNNVIVHDTGNVDILVGDLTLSAHFLSNTTGTPSTSNLGTNITSVTFTGNDDRGKIVIVVGAGGLAANTRIATCTWVTTYGLTVFPQLTNQTSGAGLAVVNFYSSAESATAFDLFCNQALVVGTYTIRYTVIG